MHSYQKRDVSAGKTARAWHCLPILIFSLAVVSLTDGREVDSTDIDRTKLIRKHTTYDVITLAPGLLATVPDINAKGQISFSMQTGKGTVGYFYNGTMVQNIGTLGGSEVIAVDLNDSGQVTGSSTTQSGNERAFIWRAGVGMLDIGVLPGTNGSEGAAVNNHGIVTGTSDTHAFRWSATEGMQNLGALTTGLTSNSFGLAVNDTGVIAGASQSQANGRHVFVWTRKDGLVDIDSLNSSDSLPVAIGARGEVAGNRIASRKKNLYEPFLWTRATGMKRLGTAGGAEAIITSMTPGLHIAGLINYANGTQRAMSWTSTAGMRKLGTLGGGSSRALDVNAKGQIIGYAENTPGDKRAFLWTAKSGMVDLNKYLRNAPPGLVLDDAVSINDNGAIVATSNAGLVLLKPVHLHRNE